MGRFVLQRNTSSRKAIVKQRTLSQSCIRLFYTLVPSFRKARQGAPPTFDWGVWRDTEGVVRSVAWFVGACGLAAARPRAARIHSSVACSWGVCDFIVCSSRKRFLLPIYYLGPTFHFTSPFRLSKPIDCWLLVVGCLLLPAHPLVLQHIRGRGLPLEPWFSIIAQLLVLLHVSLRVHPHPTDRPMAVPIKHHTVLQ